jgi:hypothetical protein
MSDKPMRQDAEGGFWTWPMVSISSCTKPGHHHLVDLGPSTDEPTIHATLCPANPRA